MDVGLPEQQSPPKWRSLYDHVVFGRVPVLLVRWVLGGIFAFASIDKILHPQSFAELIYNYQILPGAWINLTALMLPWLELLLGLLLIFGKWLRPAVILTNLLLVAFSEHSSTTWRGDWISTAAASVPAPREVRHNSGMSSATAVFS